MGWFRCLSERFEECLVEGSKTYLVSQKKKKKKDLFGKRDNLHVNPPTQLQREKRSNQFQLRSYRVCYKEHSETRGDGRTE